MIILSVANDWLCKIQRQINLETMFIRFTVEFKNEKGTIDSGIFQAAAFLREDHKTYDYDKLHLLDLKDWFNANLEKPDRFNKAKRKNGLNVSLSWFKSTATDHLQKMYEMKEILDRYDIEVMVIKRENPGYIIYEDNYQVSTLPHGKDKHLAK